MCLSDNLTTGAWTQVVLKNLLNSRRASLASILARDQPLQAVVSYSHSIQMHSMHDGSWQGSASPEFLQITLQQSTVLSLNAADFAVGCGMLEILSSWRG